jgi:hypothetical protein
MTVIPGEDRVSDPREGDPRLGAALNAMGSLPSRRFAALAGNDSWDCGA